MRKMIFFPALAEEHLARLHTIAPAWEVIHGKANHEEKDWLIHLKQAEIICGWSRQVEQECLRPDSALRWVHAWGAGVDKLPHDKLQQAGILLTNSSGIHANPISETVFAMILAFTRKLHIYVRNQLEKKWHHAHLRGEIHGTTIGIVGVGAIGTEIARIARVFNMKVLGMRRSGEPLPEVDIMYDNDGLHELLRLSDVVVVTVPLTAQTRHMIGAEQFRQMKANAFYVNIGRGQTTDTEALVHALKTKQIAGAGLDVFEQEPLPADHPLWEMDNVIITPHSSGSSEFYQDRAMDVFLHNLSDYVNSKEPSRNRVHFDLQY